MLITKAQIVIAEDKVNLMPVFIEISHIKFKHNDYCNDITNKSVLLISPF